MKQMKAKKTFQLSFLQRVRKNNYQLDRTNPFTEEKLFLIILNEVFYCAVYIHNNNFGGGAH